MTCQTCHACLDVELAAVPDDERFLKSISRGMVLCEFCGNKRCPHATDCHLACTGSNEPGQLGSVYGGRAWR